MTKQGSNKRRNEKLLKGQTRKNKRNVNEKRDRSKILFFTLNFETYFAIVVTLSFAANVVPIIYPRPNLSNSMNVRLRPTKSLICIPISITFQILNV